MIRGAPPDYETSTTSARSTRRFGRFCTCIPRSRRAVCQQFCEKSDACGILTVGTVESCVMQCVGRGNANTDGDTCEPPADEAQACLDAYEAQSCDEFTSGTQPAACEGLCEDTSNPDGGVTNRDAGVDRDGGPARDAGPERDGGPRDAGPDAGPRDGGAGVACAELDMCCDEVPANLETSCRSVVATMNDNACQQTLEGFRNGGFCN